MHGLHQEKALEPTPGSTVFAGSGVAVVSELALAMQRPAHSSGLNIEELKPDAATVLTSHLLKSTDWSLAGPST